MAGPAGRCPGRAAAGDREAGEPANSEGSGRTAVTTTAAPASTHTGQSSRRHQRGGGGSGSRAGNRRRDTWSR